MLAANLRTLYLFIKTMNPRIKLDFNKPIPAQVAKSRDIQSKMTGNPNFAIPDPSLGDVGTATD